MIALIKYSAIWTFLTALVYALPVEAQTWRPVGSGILLGISGMALGQQNGTTASFLIVHDNKRDGQGRVAWLTIKATQQPMYRALRWPQSNRPDDLEALTTIPDQPDEFLALSSNGKVYHLRVTPLDQIVEVLKVFELPNVEGNSNFESLGLQKVNGVLIAAWADRGSDEKPAKLYWATLDLDSYTFSPALGGVSLRMPWPLKDVRHVSDLKIDSSGAIFVTSAADSGNNGPFASAFYLAGTLQVEGESVNFLRSEEPVPLLRFDYHKVEAFELLPGLNGGLIFGTDDENFGSSVYLTW